MRFRLWVDKTSGLPLRALSDEPEVDVDVDALVAKAETRRVVGTHAYLFGDAVKPPGAQGTVCPNALSALLAVLKARP